MSDLTERLLIIKALDDKREGLKQLVQDLPADHWMLKALAVYFSHKGADNEAKQG